MSRHRKNSPSRTFSQAVAVMLLTAFGLVAFGTGPATAADDVSWAVRTASNDFGRDRQNYSYTANPGSEIKDALMVVNHGKETINLAVYAADGFTTDAGQLDLETKDTKPKAVGAWLHTDQSSVKIKPGKTVKVSFTIDLPKNATPGDHMGGIVTSLTRADAAEGINVDRRLAIRVRLRVGGDLKPVLAVENLHVNYGGTLNPFGKGDATVTYTIHNTGNAILTARQSASVSGPFGSLRVHADKIKDSPELLPGDSWKVSAKVPGVTPTVRLAGTVSLTPLVIDASGTITPLAAVDTTTHGWGIPWAILLLLVLLCVAVFALIRLRRRAKVREDVRVQDAIDQALRERETVDQ
ncbi:MAG: hypothetical protein JWR83_124 [Aeromicrobium sp.]|nr:hypothetical protein [Aeromicrobium sp.]